MIESVLPSPARMIVAALVLCGCGDGASPSPEGGGVGAPPDTAVLYGVWERDVVNQGDYANPYDFREIELRATFESPSGRETEFYGFHAGSGSGGHVWTLRFMPDATGPWRYRYRWTDGTPGGEGSFVVEDTGLPGPLAVDPRAPRFFETARGDPFHFRGYDLHVMAPYLPSRSLVEQSDRVARMLSDLAGQGVNFTMLDGAIGRRTDDPNTWRESWWLDGDPLRFDVATWRAFERVLDAARTEGVYVVTFAGMIYQGEQVGFDDFRPFLRYWAARLAPYSNFLGFSPTWEWTDIWSPEQVDRIMGYLDQINPFPTLLSAHDCSHAAFEDWLGFSMRQSQSRRIANSRRSGQSQGACGAPGGVADAFVDQPILGAEDIWETESGRFGHPRTAAEVRRGAWGEMMVGVMPLYSEWHPNPPPRGGEGRGWPQVRRMFDFWYEETRYREYRSLNNRVSGARGQAAAGIPGREYLVYDRDGGTVVLDASGVPDGTTLEVLWLDPATGERRAAPPVSTHRGTVELASPLGGESVLLLRTR